MWKEKISASLLPKYKDCEIDKERMGIKYTSVHVAKMISSELFIHKIHSIYLQKKWLEEINPWKNCIFQKSIESRWVVIKLVIFSRNFDKSLI